jgi:SARP family transcriptional regulator, regulator of embCAB operon
LCAFSGWDFALNMLWLNKIAPRARLDTKKAAKTAAKRAMGTAHNAFPRKFVVAGLCDGAGRHYPLQGAAIRIGRLPDNDIVLGDDDVSRHHAVIADTGGSFVITDSRSAKRRASSTPATTSQRHPHRR